ncbi:MAG: sulfite reductase subunit alpha [Comamonas sp.]
MDWIVTPARLGGALALVLGYVGLCSGVAWRLRQQRQALLRERLSLQQTGAAGAADGAAVLVVYASQTGQAEALARDTARTLHAGGCPVQLLPVQELTLAQLQASAHSLWLLSTTGEGDAPDQALSFVQQLLVQQLPQSAALQGHTAQVLALGDREYAQFCAFGLRVQAWLQAQGAQTQVVCMDSGQVQAHARALADWQTSVGDLLQTVTGQAAAGWQSADSQQCWVLRRRTHLNPGSQGGAVYLLEWEPEHGALPQWESGDLVSLCPPGEPDTPRDYTIASVPADGCLQLLVRHSVRDDGEPGVASHWLCEEMPLGTALPLRLRAHSGFRLESNMERPVVLIGNGTGLAGLYSHIKARVQQQQFDHWLLFGERSPQHDKLLDVQLQQWVEQGQLARLDRAWSRDVAQPGYVQQLLAQQADALRHWVERGAAIYVCGSLQGMAKGVDDMLREILGSEQLLALAASGRYRRDVY